jgi:hypothetical protein
MKGYRDCTADTERQKEGVVSVKENLYRNWTSSVEKNLFMIDLYNINLLLWSYNDEFGGSYVSEHARMRNA